MKIGLLIPSTSKNRDWNTIEESYLYIYTIKSFLLTYDNDHTYIFYIGIDKNDTIYDNEDNQSKLKRFCSVMKNVNIEFHYMDNIPKGHLTIMWNRLFEKAYKTKQMSQPFQHLKHQKSSRKVILSCSQTHLKKTIRNVLKNLRN